MTDPPLDSRRRPLCARRPRTIGHLQPGGRARCRRRTRGPAGWERWPGVATGELSAGAGARRARPATRARPRRSGHRCGLRSGRHRSAGRRRRAAVAGARAAGARRSPPRRSSTGEARRRSGSTAASSSVERMWAAEVRLAARLEAQSAPVTARSIPSGGRRPRSAGCSLPGDLDQRFAAAVVGRAAAGGDRRRPGHRQDDDRRPDPRPARRGRAGRERSASPAWRSPPRPARRPHG